MSGEEIPKYRFSTEDLMALQARALDLKAVELRHLENIITKLNNLDERTMDVRERLIRFEAAGYHERIKKIETASDDLALRLTVLETQGKTFSAGIAALVSVVVTILGSLALAIIKTASNAL